MKASRVLLLYSFIAFCALVCSTGDPEDDADIDVPELPIGHEVDDGNTTDKPGKHQEKSKSDTVKNNINPETNEEEDELQEQKEAIEVKVENQEEEVDDEIVKKNETVSSKREKKEHDESKSPFISKNAPIIETTEGMLQGSTMKSKNGKTIYVYQGIPYAKPPVGEFRFKPPQRAEKWEGVRDATRERNECAQMKHPTREYIGSEDCLYLNVYTTSIPAEDKATRIVWDVVVLIHGGGFTHGSGNFDDYSPENLLVSDMVLVTFNYRLGPLGFLATDDEASPGNYGLKDQLDALRWVRRNIEAFGGNPRSVTLLGYHAGAASAHFHMLSPASWGDFKDMFHGVISISGTGLSPWAHVPGKIAQQRAFKLGELVGCKDKDKDTQKLVKCLKRKQVADLVKQTPRVTEWLHDMHYPFVPVTEPKIKGKRSILHDDPEEMIKQLAGRKEIIPWIIGVASHEGLPQALQTMVFRATLNQLNEDPIKTLPHYLEMSIEPQSTAQEIAKKVWNFYLKNDTLSYGNLVKLADITSDYNYFHGVVKSVDLHSQVSESPIFVYHFSFHERDTRFVLGVPQGDDIRYIFPDRIGGVKVEYEGNIEPTVDCLVKIVQNFARDGDPTSQEFEILNNIIWPPAVGKDFKYIDIGENITVVSDGFYPERMTFWDSIEKDLREKHLVKDEL